MMTHKNTPVNSSRGNDEKRELKVGYDSTGLLYNVLWREVFQFAGKESYRGIAGTSRRFRKIYLQAYDVRMTAAEELVQTVSGAALFLREAGRKSRFCIEETKSRDWEGPNHEHFALTFIHFISALNGRLKVVQWTVAQGFPLQDPRTCASAAFSGNLFLVEWLRTNGCPWDFETCECAARKGHLALLEWARANGAPWDHLTCSNAARNGHLAVLQWARSNGCPWKTDTCWKAAHNGHLAVLQWARSNGCPWNSYTCSDAAASGHLAVLQWARANGCPWDSSTRYSALRNGHSAVYQWADANGCPE